MFEPEKNETTVAYGGLSSITCQYRVAYKAYPPSAMREEILTDIKLVFTFDWCQAITATACKTLEQRTKIAATDLFYYF